MIARIREKEGLVKKSQVEGYYNLSCKGQSSDFTLDCAQGLALSYHPKHVLGNNKMAASSQKNCL